MRWILKRSLLFYLFFNFEISFAKASVQHFIDLPAGCSKANVHPCDISSGEKSYGFESSGGTWEMAPTTVLRRYKEDFWKMASGRFVVTSQKPQWVETPFGKIHIRNTKVFINLSATKVEISTISGEPIRFVSRVPGNQYWIHAGMKKWISGMGSQGLEVGETEVIELKEYALGRARFFSDYRKGFTTELSKLGVEIQKATQILAFSHKRNTEKKMAMLHGQYLQNQDTAKRRREYGRYLRGLFRKKTEYDY